MAKMDTPGVYRAQITEHTVNTTSKGNPQFVARFNLVEKYVDDKEGMDHFEINEPGYVPWESFDEQAIGYFVLFNNPDSFRY